MKIKFTTTDMPNVANLETCRLYGSAPKPARDNRGGGMYFNKSTFFSYRLMRFKHIV